MKTFKIDINADVGEGIGNETLLLPYLSSCNIACGGHAGDLQTMDTVVNLAKTHNVKVGAHPSYPDKANFGRKVIKISDEDLLKSLQEQVLSLKEVTDKHNIKLHHIKPHGALYNKATVDKNTAEVIVKLMKQFDSEIKLYAPYNSVIAELALNENIPIYYEVFADRNYNSNLTLVSRSNENAMLHDNKDICNHVYKMITEQKVNCITGDEQFIKADTVCLHGDHPNAVENAHFLVEELQKRNIEIE